MEIAVPQRAERPRSVRPQGKNIVSASLEHAAGSLAVLLATWIAFRLHLPLSTTAFVFFPIIVVAALRFGFWQATITSFIAVACLDYFFTQPLFSFRMPNPSDWIALAAFEFAGLVVSRLSTDVLEHARVAESERSHAEKLYQLARSILDLDLHRAAGPQVADFVQRTIHPAAVAVFDSATGRVHPAGLPGGAIEELAEKAWIHGTSVDPSSERPDVWSRPLRTGEKAMGAIALRGSNLNTLIVDAVASIAAIALERAHSFDKENRAEAARQGDQLRTAVLDALAHAFKTPLTAILAASSGLLDAGALRGPEADLVELIDQEAVRLNDLATRLLQTARLDSRAVRVQHHGWTLRHLTERVMDVFADEARTRTIRIETTPNHEATAWGDAELVATALRQLVDNALKYSNPDSAITIRATVNSAETAISVHNLGPVIQPQEIDRIFERFYRGPGTEHRAPGTGLGLSIVRKVVEAHGGHAAVTSSEEAGTTFTMTIPHTGAAR